MPKALIACEFSGRVRDAFTAQGWDAWSCDLLPTEVPGQHLQCDVRDVIGGRWDLMVAFPPCTHLCSSGARWWPKKQQEQADAIYFVRTLLNAPIGRIALENPVGIISTAIRKPNQIVQPWMFGDPFMKTTCLWLKNLPNLWQTRIVEGREQACWKMGPCPDRWKKRSMTYQGFANAMAEQWSKELT